MSQVIFSKNETKKYIFIYKKTNIKKDIDDLEAQLNAIENALDNLESQNDNIHSKLKSLLESNKEVRKEMASFANKDAPTSSQSSAAAQSTMASSQQHKQLNSDISQLNLSSTSSSNDNSTANS